MRGTVGAQSRFLYILTISFTIFRLSAARVDDSNKFGESEVPESLSGTVIEKLLKNVIVPKTSHEDDL